MSFANKLENTYLNILRYVILTVATISIIAVLIASFMAVRATSYSPPKEPNQIKFENRVNDLNKGFTLENFKKDNPTQAVEQSQTQSPEQTNAPVEKPKEDPFREFIKNSATKIANNFATYLNKPELVDNENWKIIFLAYPFKNEFKGDQPVLTFYFNTLNSLSAELAKKPEVAKPYPDNQGSILIDKLLTWHLKQVNKAITTVDEENAKLQAEFKEKYDKYLAQKASIYTYAIAAGSAFGIFLCIIMLFVMVKIERNLRPLQQIVDSRKGSIT
jgi:hypothetical protein